MAELVKEGKQDVRIREFVKEAYLECWLEHPHYARSITAMTTEVIYAIDDYIRSRYKYLYDGQTELLRKPEYMVSLIASVGQCMGDCDDIALFMACIYRCLELPARFVAIRTARDTNFDHVFIEVYNGESWLTIDPTTTKGVQHVDYGRMVVYA